MSWNPWQTGQTHGQVSGAGQIHPAVQMPQSGQAGYTPEQLIAWQQYQQQYQQWHEKYYEQYQKEMQSKLGMATSASTVVTQYQMMSPAIISPYMGQSAMSQPPPPITGIPAQPPPPLINTEPTQPPPPPPPEGSNQVNLNLGTSSSSMLDLKSTPNPSYEENLKQLNTNFSSNLQTVPIEATKRPGAYLQGTATSHKIEVEKSPEEKIFDEQFGKWEEQFEKWKKENANHPDRKAYREYEMQFEEVRKKLTERRNAMMKRKLEQQVQPPQDFLKMSNQSRPHEIAESCKPSSLIQESSNISNLNTTASFYINNRNCNTIPGLDLVEKSINKDEKINMERYECNYSTNSIKYQRNSKNNVPLLVDTDSVKKHDFLKIDRDSQSFINSNPQTNVQKKIPSLLDQKFEKPDFMESGNQFNNNNNRIKNQNNRNQDNPNSKVKILSDEKVTIMNADFLNISKESVLSNEKLNTPNYNEQPHHQAMTPTIAPTNNIAALANVLSDPNVMALLNAALKSNNPIDTNIQKSNSTILNTAECSPVNQNFDKPQFSDFLKQKQPVNRLFNPKDRQYVTEVVPKLTFNESNPFDSYNYNRSDTSNTDFYSDNARDGNNSIPKFSIHQNNRENTSNPFKNVPSRDSNMEDNFYRPAQVIDYQNKSAYKRSNPFSDDLVPKKVVDYGHKPSSLINHTNIDSCNFIPAKTIDYAHASTKSIDKKREEIIANRRERKRIKREQMELMKPIYESNEDYPGPWSLLNEQERQRSGFPTKRGKKKKIKPLIETMNPVLKKTHEIDILKKDGFNNQEFEEISDEDEMSFNNDRSANVNDSPISVESKKNDDILEIIDIPKDKNKYSEQTSKSIFPVQMLFPSNQNNNTIIIDEILFNPGRKTRPKKIVIILRGPPGSGKSYVARLIKDKENDLSGSPVRLLSIDDYFMVETDKIETCPKTGRPINKKVMIYEFDEKMEEVYVEYLIKAYRRTLSDSLYDFVLIDYSNQSLRTFTEFYNTAKAYNYTPYTIDMITDFTTCSKQNDHNRNLDDIKNMIETWKDTPTHYIKLNISSLLHGEIQEVEMDDAISLSDSENSDVPKVNETDNENSESLEASDSSNFLKSKWDSEFSEEGLARLDGASKKNYQKRSTMQDYLQIDDIWEPPKSSDSNKKRVRWADIEEKKAQDKMRAIGFIVGQTDWKRMMDPTQGSSALTKTKYIDKVKKPYRK